MDCWDKSLWQLGAKPEFQICPCWLQYSQKQGCVFTTTGSEFKEGNKGTWKREARSKTTAGTCKSVTSAAPFSECSGHCQGQENWLFDGAELMTQRTIFFWMFYPCWPHPDHSGSMGYIFINGRGQRSEHSMLKIYTDWLHRDNLQILNDYYTAMFSFPVRYIYIVLLSSDY